LRSIGAGEDMRHTLTADRHLVWSVVVSVPLDDAGARVRRQEPDVAASFSFEF
jgi:hypothetical protein